MKVSEHGLMFQGGIVIGIGGVLMLALSRKTNESIMLGDDIEVTILEAGSGKRSESSLAPTFAGKLKEAV